MSVSWKIDTSKLAQGVQDGINALLSPLPYDYVIVSGWRSAAAQNALYQQGRDSNGNVINKAAVVTNAKAGQSAHSPPGGGPALAVDAQLIVNGQAVWDPNHPGWVAYDAAADASPLFKSGRTFDLAGGDYDHIEVRNWRLFINQPIQVDVTATGAGSGASSADGTSGPVLSGPLPVSTPEDEAVNIDTGSSTSFVVDAGMVVAVAAVMALIILVRRRSGA